MTLRLKKIKRKKNAHTEIKFHTSADDLPPPPPLSGDTHFNKVLDCMRAFEIQQMSYDFKLCTICHERTLKMKMSIPGICNRCQRDKSSVRMFSQEDSMYPVPVPDIMQGLSLVEQQLISPALQVHMLKLRGIAASGYCVAFPQNINE